MKAVILAGGLGSRLSEETTLRPKPMVEIGGKPILWHIMRHYSLFGIDEFVICLGYKGYMIKEWFANYALHTSDVTLDLATGELHVHSSRTEPWRVTLIDTGAATMTGGRLKRALPYLDDETFMMTYGDGVADIDISALLESHRLSGLEATVTAVQPPGRFGALRMEETGSRVEAFDEKPQGDGAWLNGGFFVLEPGVIDRIADDSTVWEESPLRSLTADDQLNAYRHRGFWHPMDTLRDREYLESRWASGDAPWAQGRD